MMQVIEKPQYLALAENSPCQDLNRYQLEVLASLNPYHKEAETLLLSHYKRIKTTWSSSAIKNLQKATGLKLTNKLNRCQFALAAAQAELQFYRSTPASEELAIQNYSLSHKQSDDCNLVELDQETEQSQQWQARLESTQQQLEQAQAQLAQLETELQTSQQQLSVKEQKLAEVEKFSFLLLTNRLLPPGPPLNGSELSPAMRILGEPKTLIELEANYRELIKREHPDISVHPQELAVQRFTYVRSLYKLTRQYWEKLKPTAAISQVELEKRMKAPVPFEPQSFWAA